MKLQGEYKAKYSYREFTIGIWILNIVIISGMVLFCIVIFFPDLIILEIGVISIQAAIISAIFSFILWITRKKYGDRIVFGLNTGVITDLKRIKEVPEWYASEMKKILNTHKIFFTYDNFKKTVNGYEIRFILPLQLEFIIDYRQMVTNVFTISGTIGPINQENEIQANEYITMIKQSVKVYDTITFPPSE
jgi:hypothetical protein